MTECCTDCEVYELGALVKTIATFTDPDSTTAPVDPTTGNTLIDPDHVFLDVTAPNTATVTYEYLVDGNIHKTSTGIYYCNIDTTPGAGGWTYRWYATGNGQSAKRGAFQVTS